MFFLLYLPTPYKVKSLDNVGIYGLNKYHLRLEFLIEYSYFQRIIFDLWCGQICIQHKLLYDKVLLYFLVSIRGHTSHLNYVFFSYSTCMEKKKERKERHNGAKECYGQIA